ncbi:helix-turn-helix domain-containing protein [Symplocastrum sp. BBK-W-15]|uniref:Helix-turn-helix domain-containing protein n=1 Tax=Limnofasciculus baicalensis BBK-W-15 TaxID=2699891 RepID=A0AAE3GVK4_9CYAN|nr:helix-turn-helix domain-containing protein [Limnofasciculus baicalensis]MCP2731525.1 helix-turn-helix domain-containing protein [Limnofasciculus baicalensis BBK-W-15]
MLEQEKEKEIKELDEWMKGILDGRELKRGIAVKLVKQGWAYRAIAEILNVSNSFISK